MSATLDPAPYQKFFGGEEECQVVWLEGQRRPLELRAVSHPVQDYVSAAQLTVLQLHKSRPITDHLLVFLTGEEEILESVAALRAVSLPAESDQQSQLDATSSLFVVPLYAALSPQAQRRALEPAPPGRRKVILATNIAESSLTIAGVRLVLDCGRAKVKEVSAGGLEELRVRWISQAQAWQRAGRANRQTSGHCFRLYTQEQYNAMDEQPIPELLRCHLASATLHMLAMGYDPRQLDLMDSPPPERLEDSLELLRHLGAVNGDQLCPLGRQLNHLPLDPRLARVVLAATQLGCLMDALKVVSLLSVDDLLPSRAHLPLAKRERAAEVHHRFKSSRGDLHTALNVLNAFFKVKGNAERKRWLRDHCIDQRALNRAIAILRQLRQLCERHGIQVGLQY